MKTKKSDSTKLALSVDEMLLASWELAVLLPISLQNKMDFRLFAYLPDESLFRSMRCKNG